MENEILIKMENISKEFSGIQVLNNISMEVRKGEVHALLGENGAGKSTLMKILSGMYTDYEGNIFFEGEETRFKSEKAALEKGIAIVPQELNPIPDLTIAENIYLGREPSTKFGVVDRKKRLKDTRDFMEKLGLNYDPLAKLSELSVAQKQMIEIIKAISRNARLIIMDEPTSALTNTETEYLFEQIEKLKQEGIAIIFISHKLDEIYRICDSTTILRDGQWIGTGKLNEIDEDTLISMMVGRKVKDIYPKLPTCKEKVVLEVSDLSGIAFENASFTVKEGEILGFAGMMGSGRTEIVRTIFGMDKKTTGEIKVEGKKIEINNVKDAITNGIAMVTEDRTIYGIVSSGSIKENIALPNGDEFCKRGLLSQKKIKKQSDEICTRLKVKAANLDVSAGTLSGGNQQKVVLAKWLIRNLKILILDEPTRGIDIGAKQEIYKLITELAKGGMAIILISSELPEVLAMSHRVKVLADGHFTGEFTHDEVTQNKVMKTIVEGRKKYEKQS